MLLERFHDLQRREDAERPVEPPPRRLAVEVTPEHERGSAFGPGAAGPIPAGEHVADPVDGQREAQRLDPPPEEIARPTVLVAQGEAADARGRSGADARHLLEAPPEPVSVHPESGDRGHGPESANACLAERLIPINGPGASCR